MQLRRCGNCTDQLCFPTSELNFTRSSRYAAQTTSQHNTTFRLNTPPHNCFFAHKYMGLECSQDFAASFDINTKKYIQGLKCGQCNALVTSPVVSLCRSTSLASPISLTRQWPRQAALVPRSPRAARSGCPALFSGRCHCRRTARPRAGSRCSSHPAAARLLHEFAGCMKLQKAPSTLLTRARGATCRCRDIRAFSRDVEPVRSQVLTHSQLQSAVAMDRKEILCGRATRGCKFSQQGTRCFLLTVNINRMMSALQRQFVSAVDCGCSPALPPSQRSAPRSRGPCELHCLTVTTINISGNSCRAARRHAPTSAPCLAQRAATRATAGAASPSKDCC